MDENRLENSTFNRQLNWYRKGSYKKKKINTNPIDTTEFALCRVNPMCLDMWVMKCFCTAYPQTMGMAYQPLSTRHSIYRAPLATVGHLIDWISQAAFTNDQERLDARKPMCTIWKSLSKAYTFHWNDFLEFSIGLRREKKTMSSQYIGNNLNILTWNWQNAQILLEIWERLICSTLLKWENRKIQRKTEDKLPFSVLIQCSPMNMDCRNLG